MDWRRFLAVLALLGIATAVGGAAVRLVDVLGSTPALVTVLVVAILLVAAVGRVTSRSRPSTPYW